MTSGRVRVLLVDDDRSTRELVRILLERSGHFEVVAEADSAADAAEAAREVRPDIVVMDWEMPGMSGLEAVPLIRNAAATSKIVLFSDRVQGLFAREAKACAADLLLPKGNDLSLLVPALIKVHSAK